ncbi:DUF6531 domain-containing protein [Streptomyces sp. NBC_01186]|uniref:putative T7SS-secreted protein n=1 Tax=Streptomyces sp. NBC_01186 TaxID=2903765 RepID=UPI002E15867D|nr:DUF6531 domain-containing protein [Streptomyces sp. NBC_01186]
MTQKDATEGGTVERIPPHAKPSEVIYGSPSKIDDLVIKLLAYAGAFKDGNAKLDDLSLLDWTGAGSEGFMDATKKLPRELDSAHSYFTSAANALDAYADKLRSVHRRLKPIIEDADAARAASKTYWEDYTAYSKAVDAKADPLPKRPPDDDPGIAALESCYARLDKLESELDGVIETSKRKLEKAAEKAPDKPKGWKGWKQHGKDYLSGAGESLLGMYEGFDDLVNGGPGGAGLQLAGTADGAAYAAAHPKEFAKAVTNWEEWQRNPSRAAGQLTPELLLALASGGAGALRKGASAAKNAAQRLAGRERALRRDGSARDRVDDGPANPDTCKGDKCEAGDPVDVTTGEMLMSATDADLPGALPLTLTRDFVSGHTCGGWFGPTWAGTLDQRLELDDQGVVYVADDGMLLTYPVPRREEPTLPRSGPRWPLCWDGKPDGTMTITQPERNRTLHFAPLPMAGRELPLRAITDRTGEGDRVTFTYDEQGTPTRVTHSGGYRIAVDTDPALHRVTALRLLHGDQQQHSTKLISYGYDQAGDLTEVINSTGLPLRYRYDDQHRITSWTDRNNTSFAYVYDHRGRVLRTVGPDGMMSGRFHYDQAARTTRYTNSLGRTTAYVYNEARKVTAETDPLGNTTHTEWDETNRLRTAVTDPLGHTTRYTYDDEGRLTAVEGPDGRVTEAVYDDWGLPVEVHEANGAVWRHTYDERGARTSTTDPYEATTRYTYDAHGHLATICDPLGHTTQVTTDAAGLPATVTDPLGHTTTVRRGPHGHVSALTDALGRTTRHGWTIEGRPAWRETPDGAREEWKWDAEGNLAQHTDQSGHTTTYTHSHFDLPVTRTDPDGANYAFTYDTELHLTRVTNAQGLEWRYEYDAAGRLTSETDFNGATFAYERDAVGGLLARTNARGETLRYTRDAAGRMVTQCDESTGEETTFTYDAGGALAHAANATAQLTCEYDLLGRLLVETVNGRTTTYGYDATGNRTHRTTPSGLTSTWAYDPAGLPATLTTAGHTLTFGHDAAGRETRRALADLTLSQRWDAADRLTAQTLTSSAPDPLQHRTYTYRPDGHVTEIRELTAGTRHYALDPVGRVTKVQAHGWTETYAYDTAGNQSHAEAPGHPSPGEREHQGTLIRRAGRTTYEHDTAGRLTRKTRTLLNGRLRTWTYAWNAQDRLTSVTTPTGQAWYYTYDPLGRRLTKSGPDGPALTFAWDGTRLAEQSTPDGTATTWDHAPGTHRPLAQTDREPGSTRFHAILTDLTGTPTELVAPSGEVVRQHRTTLWGTPLPSPSGALDCPLRFPGQYADPETGLHYNYFRYYDPETARFLTPDPLGLAPAPDHHAYVANPHAEIDPLGLAGCKEKPKLSDRNPIPNKKLRHEYEEVLAGRGTQRPGDAPDGLDYYSADKLPPKQQAQWKDSAIYDVPGTPHRVLKRPDGLIGYVWNHDYSKPRLFPAPWYKDGGDVPKLPKEQR